MTIAIAKVSMTLGLIPRAVMLRKLGCSDALVKSMVGSRRRPIPSLLKAIQLPSTQVHTCCDMEWDGDGPSPAEFCDACQHEMCQYNIQAQKEMLEARRNYDPSKYATAVYSTWDEVQEEKSRELAMLASYDLEGLMQHDFKNGINRPWWFYQELEEERQMTREDREAEKKKSFEEFKAFKLLQAEHGYWFEPEEVRKAKAEAAKKVEEDLKAYRDKLAGIKEVEMPDNAREYIRSVDRRSGKEREVEFEEWLAIPKNKRPIFLEGGKKGPAVAKADIGSVVIKNCPPSVLLCDIRLVLARFGGVRDVYRPRDRATGKPKPFVFVEMLKNAEAWSAVDHFAKHPFVLDDNTFTTEGAGERKTSEEMAVAQPAALEPIKVEAAEPKESKKSAEKSKPAGAFAALMDSDSDTD
jgi:hypothetical protein